MSERKIRDETDQLMADEAEAVALLLAKPGRCVMVHITIVEECSDDEGDLVRHGHGVGGDTKGRHLRGFQIAAKRQLEWLLAKGRVV